MFLLHNYIPCKHWLSTLLDKKSSLPNMSREIKGPLCTGYPYNIDINCFLKARLIIVKGIGSFHVIVRIVPISSKTWCHGLSLISNNPHMRCEHLCIIFLDSAPSEPNLFSITGITSGIAFDRPNRLSRLRAFPYDRFKIYMIVPIVRIELNSIQAIEVVSVVRVVCDRLGSISIWSSEHFLRRLGRSGQSGRSYGNQA